jgi:hypothetical protein
MKNMPSNIHFFLDRTTPTHPTHHHLVGCNSHHATDFMLGPLGADGADSYVLGEINVSSVFPIPAEAPAEIASRVADRLRSNL